MVLDWRPGCEPFTPISSGSMSWLFWPTRLQERDSKSLRVSLMMKSFVCWFVFDFYCTCFVLLFCQCLRKELIDFLHVSPTYKSLSLYFSPYTSPNAEQTPVRKPVYMQVYMSKQKFQSECSVKSLCEYQSNISLNDMSVSQSVEYMSFWKRFLRKRTAVCSVAGAL